MKKIWFCAIPFDKNLVTLALESGVDALVAEENDVEAITSLGRVQVFTPAVPAANHQVVQTGEGVGLKIRF